MVSSSDSLKPQYGHVAAYGFTYLPHCLHVFFFPGTILSFSTLGRDATPTTIKTAPRQAITMNIMNQLYCGPARMWTSTCNAPEFPLSGLFELSSLPLYVAINEKFSLVGALVIVTLI